MKFESDQFLTVADETGLVHKQLYSRYVIKNYEIPPKDFLVPQYLYYERPMINSFSMRIIIQTGVLFESG